MRPSPQKARAESPPAREGGREVPALPSSRCSGAACHTPGRQRHGGETSTGSNFPRLSCTLRGARQPRGRGRRQRPLQSDPGHSLHTQLLLRLGSFPTQQLEEAPPGRQPSPLPPRRLLCARDSARGRVASSAPPASASSLRIPRGRDAGGGC